MGRAPCCDKSKVKRGPWSPDEDITLKNYVERYGSGGNWIALPHKAGLKRCGKSCRLRWLNYLRPDIKHGGFTEEEDNIILTLYSTMGSRWSVIASHLQGRTDNDVKNHWNTKLKKKYLLAAGKTILKTTTTTNCDITTNNSMDFSSKPSSAFLSEVDTNCSNTNSNSLPYYTMKVNYDHQHNFVPLPVPENNATTAFSTSFSTSQEANSTLFSSQNNNAWWFGNGSTGEDHDGLLMDSGSGFPYDLLNGFDQFQEKTSDFVYPNLAHSL